MDQPTAGAPRRIASGANGTFRVVTIVDLVFEKNGFAILVLRLSVCRGLFWLGQQLACPGANRKTYTPDAGRENAWHRDCFIHYGMNCHRRVGVATVDGGLAKEE